MSSASDREARRILAEYERRERELDRDQYSPTRPENLFLLQGQQRALLAALARSSALPLDSKRILEVGCGRGKWLAVFEDFGANRANLAGIDLDERRLDDARARFPAADLRAGDATRLPWEAESFDLVFQSLVMTSILDAEVRKSVALEMQRVVRRGGIILWYDFLYDNPSNSNVRGVRASEIRRLFDRCQVELQRVSLAPPLVRRIVPRSWLVASVLERARFLNTHYFGVIRPHAGAR